MPRIITPLGGVKKINTIQLSHSHLLYAPQSSSNSVYFEPFNNLKVSEWRTLL